MKEKTGVLYKKNAPRCCDEVQHNRKDGLSPGHDEEKAMTLLRISHDRRDD